MNVIDRGSHGSLSLHSNYQTITSMIIQGASRLLLLTLTFNPSFGLAILDPLMNSLLKSLGAIASGRGVVDGTLGTI